MHREKKTLGKYEEKNSDEDKQTTPDDHTDKVGVILKLRSHS